MSNNLSTVFITKYEPSHFADLCYDLDEVQSKYTRSMYTNIVEDEIEKIHGKFPCTILFENKAVGFVVLDRTSDRLHLTNNPNSLLLRGLSINPVYQGLGIGKKALIEIESYAQSLFPDLDEIVLTVNQENNQVYQMYLKLNYVDTGRFKEGKFGLQHMMYKRI